LGRLLDKGDVVKDLDIEFVELNPERVVATKSIDRRHLQPFGYLHGGVSAILAESVASSGAFLNCPPGKGAFGSGSTRAASGPSAPGDA
jgi:1,4-dihydroxy-2-naphthoyl-CoA hydrolase